MSFFKKRPLVTLGLLVLTLVVLPATVFLIQKQVEVRSRAQKTVILSFSPTSSQTSPIQVAPNTPVALDVMIDPGANAVSFIKVQIQYDPAILSASSGNVFQINSTAFPQIIEGPTFSSGQITFSASVGSDPTKVIQSPTKIGTLTLQSLASATNATTTLVSFGSNSQALSVSSNSSPTENVIANTLPATLLVGNIITPIPTAPIPTSTPIPPTITPTPTNAPTATSTPSPTSRPTNTPTPTNGPTATATPTSVPSMNIALNILLHGIGQGGDNVNNTAISLSNKNPLHQTRNGQVFIYDANNLLVATADNILTYNATNGNYTGTVQVQPSLGTGFYTVRMRVGQHLTRLVPGIQSLSAGQTNSLQQISLVTGDVNDDNQLNILDYNMIIDCYSDLAPPVSCPTQSKKDATDINDDGAVNQFDYNLFLREISTQPGQ